MSIKITDRWHSEF